MFSKSTLFKYLSAAVMLALGATALTAHTSSHSEAPFITQNQQLGNRGKGIVLPINGVNVGVPLKNIGEVSTTDNSISTLAQWPRPIFPPGYQLPRPILPPGYTLDRPRAFVSGFVGEPIYATSLEFDLPNTIANPVTNSVIIGMASWPARDVLYARVAPGNRIVEMTSSGRILRSFTAQRVNPGCGLVSMVLTCGLTIRWSDGHLFLDQPNFGSRTIVEIDNDGNWVRNINHLGPSAAISGLGYHQPSNRLWALFPVNRTFVEFTLDGQVQQQFSRPGSTFQPNGLAVSPTANELIVPGTNGTSVSVFDFQGNYLRDRPLNRTRVGFLGGGVAAGNPLPLARFPRLSNL